MKLNYEEAKKMGLRVCEKCERIYTNSERIQVAVLVALENKMLPATIQMWSPKPSEPLHVCLKTNVGYIPICGITNLY